MEERYRHCIFVGSNYTTGKRKGLHYLYNPANIRIVLEKASDYAGKDGVSVYFVTTNQPTIQSVQEKDSFFNSIEISEGTEKRNVALFDESLNNQITIIDVALLLLSREKMTIRSLKVYLFFCYCLYAKEIGGFPFRNKFYLDKQSSGFKEIDSFFNDSSIDKDKTLLKCSKRINVLMSKFFNCEGGVELMNKVLEIFYSIKTININILEFKMKTFIENIISVKKSKRSKYLKENSFMPYLVKKDLDYLNI